MKKVTVHLLAIAFLLVSCSPSHAYMISTPQTTSSPSPTQTATSMTCLILHVPTTPETALESDFEGHAHIIGNEEAAVTMILFSDYQCDGCALLASSLRQIRLTHPDDVRLIFFHAPQATRNKDDLAIQAVEAADLQGKFWEMNDLLFEKLEEWSTLKPGEFEAWAGNQAASLGIDTTRFQSDFEGSQVTELLQQAVQFAAGIKNYNPPILFINSASPYTGLVDFASLDIVVRLDALVKRQFSACPPEVISPLRQYIITLHTIKGDVMIQLFPEKAPQAVNNFVFLAQKGWYDGITFYRVLPDEMVKSGDPSETGLGNPGYLFDTEINSGLRFDQPGMLAMDNDGPGTNGSRFFITLSPAPQLDGQYTILGQVLSGLEILKALETRDPKPGIYLNPGDELISVTTEEH
jgi:cyclophilin family peptidyl-prolyl cis-trans isomerase/protein-disulfide isomerase